MLSLLASIAVALVAIPLASAQSMTTLYPISTATEAPQFFPTHSPMRQKVSYGPFTVPDSSTNSGMIAFSSFIPLPCSDCLITSMQAGLEYTDGTTANADTGLWLHHVVLYNDRRANRVCLDQGVTRPEAIFASGNERTPINICVNGTEKAGYHLTATDQVALAIELMNMNSVHLEGVLTITYEFLPFVPSGFAHANPIWLDIGGCFNRSEVPAHPDSAFEYTSTTWLSLNTSGRIVFTAAHLHDGGTHLEIRKNGETICDAVAAYDETAAYSSGHLDTGASVTDLDDIKHISSLSICANTGRLEVGDKLDVTAYYDTETWTPMMNNAGMLEPVMGISLLYVVEDLKGPTALLTGQTSSSLWSLLWHFGRVMFFGA